MPDRVLNRRAVIAGALATAGALAIPLPQPNASEIPRTTIIWTPHPDDETLRLAAYITMAANRGDQLVLVTVTDGEGSSACSPLTKEECAEARAVEQTLAVSHLGAMAILRLRMPDGGVNFLKVEGACRALMAIYPNAEHYTACRTDDAHPDHRAVANGVKSAGPLVVRQSYEPGTQGGWSVSPTNTAAVQAAYDVYQAGIGGESVPDLFHAAELDPRSWIST